MLAYEQFRNAMGDLLNVINSTEINDEKSYEEALSLIDTMVGQAAESSDESLHAFIDVLAARIDEYESKQEGMEEFLKKAEQYNTDGAVLSTVMHIHNLTGKDLPQIGNKSVISKIVNGKRKLTRKQILTMQRIYHVNPVTFFEVDPSKENLFSSVYKHIINAMHSISSSLDKSEKTS